MNNFHVPLPIVVVFLLVFSISFVFGARTPTVGGDTNNWGTILNEFLQLEDTASGTHGNVTADSLNVSGNLVVNTSVLFVNATSGNVLVARLENIRFADRFSTLQAAFDDAGTTGTVLIPSSYNGTDNFTNPNKIPVIDLRGGVSRNTGQFNVKDFGAKGDGVTDDRTALANADAAATASGTVYIPPGTYRIASSLKLSSRLVFSNGAVLSPDTGVTVTIAGLLEAGLFKIFTVGAGTISFASTNASYHALELIPQWWGAKGDGVTDDVEAIQAALNASSSQWVGIVRLPPGTYLVSRSIQLRTRVSLVGSGVSTSLGVGYGGTTIMLANNSNTDVLFSNGTALHWVVIRDLGINCNKANNSAGNGIYIGGQPGEGMKVEHVFIANCAQNGIYLDNGVVPLYWEDLHLFNNDGSGIKLYRSVGTSTYASVTLLGVSGDDNGVALIEIDGRGGAVDQIVIMGVKSEANTAGRQRDAIRLVNISGSHVFITGVWAGGSAAADSAIKIAGTAAAQVVWHNVFARASTVPNILNDTVNNIAVRNNAASNSSSMSGANFALDYRGGIQLGGGTKILKHLSNQSTLNFPNTAAQTSSDLNITVTGAALGDTVTLGVPNGSVNANSLYTAWVSAADTVTVRFNNYSNATIDPASGTFRVDVWQH